MSEAGAVLAATAWTMLLLLCDLPACFGANITTASDAKLLLGLRDTFTNGAAKLQDWESGTDPCGWSGVECDAQGRVTSLTLEELGLEGTIPSAGYELPPTTQSFSLFANNITGPLPTAWQLPSGLAQLELSTNQLTGTLPADFVRGDNLTTLLLDFNQLSGTLPASSLPDTVQELSLAWNHLEGPIDGYPLPASAMRASLDNNRFNGTLSGSWELPAGLAWLDVSGNELRGSLPNSWDLPPAMNFGSTSVEARFTGLSLHNNSLSGTLPTWPNASDTNVFVGPGNSGLCGEIPYSPNYYYHLWNSTAFDIRKGMIQLSPCDMAPPPPQPSGNESSMSTGAIVGTVVGAVCGTALVCGLAVWIWRRKAGQMQPPDLEKGGQRGDAGPSIGTNIGSSLSSSPDILTASKAVNDKDSAGAGSTPRLLQRSHEQSQLMDSDPILASIVSKYSSPSRREPSEWGMSSQGSRRGVDMEPWLIDFRSQLQLKRMIGAGSFGRVYLATWNETVVAAKLLLDHSSPEMVLPLSHPAFVQLHQEAAMMLTLRHPNILSFLGLCLSPPTLVSEYCPRGSLFDILRQAKDSPAHAQELNWPLRLRIAMGAALGCLHLHSRSPPVIHRDLKSPNLLLSSNWTVKVADFNLSKIWGESSAGSSLAIANPRWLAPEVISGGTHTTSSDVFAYGIVLWELLTLSSPWEDVTNPWQITSHVLEGKRPLMPSQEELARCKQDAGFAGLDSYVELVQQCWAQDPGERPGFTAIVAALRSLLGSTGSKAEAQEGELPGSTGSAGSPPPSGLFTQPGAVLKVVPMVRTMVMPLSPFETKVPMNWQGAQRVSEQQ